MTQETSREARPLATLAGEVLVPVLMTGWILVYAWDLRDVPERHINWLLLMPLMSVCLGLLAFILFKDVVPSLRAGALAPSDDDLSTVGFRVFGLDYRPIGIVVLLVVYASAAFAGAYLPATAVFVAASAFLLGERRPVSLLLLALTTTAALYAVGRLVLGIDIH